MCLIGMKGGERRIMINYDGRMCNAEGIAWLYLLFMKGKYRS